MTTEPADVGIRYPLYPDASAEGIDLRRPCRTDTPSVHRRARNPRPFSTFEVTRLSPHVVPGGRRVVVSYEYREPVSGPSRDIPSPAHHSRL